MDRWSSFRGHVLGGALNHCSLSTLLHSSSVGAGKYQCEKKDVQRSREG
ncbi:hypothetical protein BDA96_08G036400 [Sorghum bicolor]|uniref:Uncharacterized protein n=2 Tax=Sorghum bicolor TaxID=4558 RepID=A0A921QE68_SORBI|nr:hypothetical protein BDA96_08G036400 [Sorghum bicolor]OQU78690.1 hypothetical protein SORBI_3008G032850 [Sorghum bicolor]